MKTPFLLLGSALLFWGWQTGLWPLAIIMALCLEGPRLIRSRLDLSLSDFSRVSDLCSLILLGMLVYLFASQRSAGALLVLIQWFPMAFFPLVFAQVYSTSDRIDVSAFFLILRIERVKRENILPAAINVTFPYFGLCVLSASAANVRAPWFYAGFFVLSAWALWSVRSRRYAAFQWIGPLLLLGCLGYAGHMGLHQLQLFIEDKTVDWLAAFTKRDADPYRARTAIGDIGSLKLSDRILFRVEAEPSHGPPFLLREASYNVYKASRWFASRARFRPVRPELDGSTWKLNSDPGKGRITAVSSPLKGGKGLLKLPAGSFEVARLPVLKMEKNQYGAVRVEEGPGLVHYQVRFRKGATYDSPPRWERSGRS